MVVSKYIDNPLLVDGRKFTLRVFVLVGRVQPALVLCRPGYCKLSIEKYVTDLDVPIVHFTNVGWQQLHPDFPIRKEDMIWSTPKLAKYLVAKSGLTQSPTLISQEIMPRIRSILAFCVRRGLPQLQVTSGTFSLIAADFLIDRHLNPWLVSMTRTPDLHPHTMGLVKVMEPLIKETLDIVLALAANGGDADAVPVSGGPAAEIPSDTPAAGGIHQDHLRCRIIGVHCAFVALRTAWHLTLQH